jgi:hypothetical protein
MKRILFQILFIGACLISAHGQEVKVKSSFDTTSIYIGDQIGYTIEIDQPAKLKLEIPFFKDTLNKKIEIISGPVTDTSVNNGRIRVIQKYLITSFDSGRYQLPPVFAESKEGNNIKRYYSEYALLEVKRVPITPADTTAQIFDIIKPYRAPVTLGEILPWALLGILLAALVWLSIRYFRRYRNSKAGVEPVTIHDPAHIIAFRELTILRDEQLWQKGEIKYYYTRLTEILRQYLENRFGVYSLEMTTSETLEALVRTGFKKEKSYKLLKEVLTGADLVKFAKYNPEPSENDINFQSSWEFVEATKLIDIQASVAGDEEAGKEVAL